MKNWSGNSFMDGCDKERERQHKLMERREAEEEEENQ